MPTTHLIRINENGRLDDSFTSAPIYNTTVTDVAVDSRNRILVSARHDDEGLYVRRYLDNGNVDPEFNFRTGARYGDSLTEFFMVAGERASSVAADSRNRVVLAGSGDGIPGRGYDDGSIWAVARLKEDGTADTSFDGDGKVLTNFGSRRTERANAVAVDSRDRVVAAGWAANPRDSNGDSIVEVAVGRYLTNGALDTAFDRDGKVLTRIDKNGRATERSLSVRPRPIDIAVNGRDEIVVASTSSNWREIAVTRYLERGQLDPAFGEDGVVVFGFDPQRRASVSTCITVDSGNRVIVGGMSIQDWDQQFAFTRLTDYGRPDQQFGQPAGGGSGDRTGSAVINFFSRNDEMVHAVAVDSQNRVIGAGLAGVDRAEKTEVGICRLDNSGDLDRTFDGDGKALPLQFVPEHKWRRSVTDVAMAIDADDRAVIAYSE